MTISYKVLSSDREPREALARRVGAHFDSLLTKPRVLCFLDDQDSAEVKGRCGPLNRGVHFAILALVQLEGLPRYLINCAYRYDKFGHLRPREIDNLIYLHNETCLEPVGMTMTLAHELQHAVQHHTSFKLWALNSITFWCPQLNVNRSPFHLPIEHESRLISKRVSIKLHGEDQVNQYLDWRITNSTGLDNADWQWVRALNIASEIDLAARTRDFFRGLNVREKADVKQALAGRKEHGDPDYVDINLEDFFG